MKHYFEISFLISIFLVSFHLSSESIDKIKEGDLIFQETFSELMSGSVYIVRYASVYIKLLFFETSRNK
ncbi:hypothetical protein LEP1GSC104_0353 [Leptospira interrogans str. UI 12621]|uniref:Uncharacterized protein n=1 Tax=Leptospira interrogans str. UI 12621 TaxID=1049937 RepID=A0A0F6H984_LEPIR|nr:hypothetical protein LEP1GSC080_1202 [Leptospira interrogans str. FPW2026]EKO24823.1 hypothetical protein LEP1GSC104_0353 [Leptospira interrogans str. UI 12621]EMN83038.1 hypothetical protein LEP1GSC106_1308 [Leptospira interrogans serovar Grippotyphosa str. UI 12764]